MESPENTTKNSTSPRKPWLAAALTLLTPGLGQLYVGAPKRAFVAWAATMLAVVVGVVMVLVLPGRLELLVGLPIIFGVPVVVAVDAMRLARARGGSYERRWYNRWYVYATGVAISTFVVGPAVESFLQYAGSAFRLPSASMAPTLLPGDYILASPLKRAPNHEELVVYQSERGMFVHRIVGVGRDTLEMREGHLIVNGRTAEERYVIPADADPVLPELAWQRQLLLRRADTASYRPSLSNWGPLVLPPEQYFVLGDNRGASADSRYIGLVPRGSIRARPAIVYFSRDPQSGRMRWSRIGLRVDRPPPARDGR